MEHERDNYISPIVESLMPEATHEELLDATQNLWVIFDLMYSLLLEEEKQNELR
jgi:hypothetical protein